MSKDSRLMNAELRANLLGTMREDKLQETEDPVVRALRFALEVSTPFHAGQPHEHPDHPDYKRPFAANPEHEPQPDDMNEEAYLSAMGIDTTPTLPGYNGQTAYSTDEWI